MYTKCVSSTHKYSTVYTQTQTTLSCTWNRYVSKNKGHYECEEARLFVCLLCVQCSQGYFVHPITLLHERVHAGDSNNRPIMVLLHLLLVTSSLLQGSNMEHHHWVSNTIPVMSAVVWNTLEVDWRSKKQSLWRGAFNLHSFLWPVGGDSCGTPRGSPHKHTENMQTPHRRFQAEVWIQNLVCAKRENHGTILV